MAKNKNGDVHEWSGDSSNSSEDVIEYDPNSPQETLGAADEADETNDTLGIEDDWFAAQAELEVRMGGTDAFVSSLRRDLTDYRPLPDNIVGTGIGFRSADGQLTPDIAVKLYVNEKVPVSRLSEADTAPASVSGKPVDVEAVGDIVPQSYARRYARPVRCGVSIGHPQVTAGTLGCLVVLNNRKLCLLSNNHVIANSNNAKVGDRILQPGRADGGQNPDDTIGLLEQFVPIQFPGPNLVDAAVGWTSSKLVSPKHVTYDLNPKPIRARLGMTVMKNGRTTQATVGSITDLSVNIRVGYPGGVAQFRDQIGVRGIGGIFSRGGDSGSIIVTARTKQPVALLFAGRRDNSITFANPVGAVMQSLDIRKFVGG